MNLPVEANVLQKAGTLYRLNNDAVRTVTLNDELWLVSVDVCKVLGFPRVDNALRTLGADQRMVLKRTDPRLSEGDELRVFTNRSPNISIISESGLYRLIFRSNKPEARSFQNWVTDTVLPAIRKDRAYFMGEEKIVSNEVDEDEFLAKAMLVVQRKIDRLIHKDKAKTFFNDCTGSIRTNTTA